MRMPTYKRRYFLGLLSRRNQSHAPTPTSTENNSKGRRSSKVSGDDLKNLLISGSIQA